jgi:predicted nucleic acid-binding protein
MSSRSGRRSSTQGVHAIEDQELLLPDPIALDTSFVVEALIPTQRLHELCSAFLHRIAQSGIRVVTSELLEVELAEAVFKITLRDRWGREWQRRRSDGRARRGARGALIGAAAAYQSMIISSAAHVSIPVSRVSRDAMTLMSDHGLASYDAVHAATAIASGAEAIVTTDTGFAALPSAMLSIYTDRSRVPAARRRRPR